MGSTQTTGDLAQIFKGNNINFWILNYFLEENKHIGGNEAWDWQISFKVSSNNGGQSITEKGNSKIGKNELF